MLGCPLLWHLHHSGVTPQAKDASHVAPELSAMVVYCQATPFPGLAQALQQSRPYEMSSFSERKARKLIKEAGPTFVRYTSRQLSRVYPLGLKMTSSNYNPQEMWNAGCQLVALNFQTPGYEMDLNTGRFLGNGGCGYVLKPQFLLNPHSGSPHPLVLCIRVITAQQLPKLNREKLSSIVDPFVRVEIYGVTADCSKQQTTYRSNNGDPIIIPIPLSAHQPSPIMVPISFNIPQSGPTFSSSISQCHPIPPGTSQLVPLWSSFLSVHFNPGPVWPPFLPAHLSLTP
ncbi:1-phosphatidylinositol 4,5-bisphosphate phosphodiesterase delta-3-like isoform X1 [Lagopus leucura]|uniref:1-phosphatidylinositol 4,5-bisphosphate phosphodiesterase delta-3-like isoform X1 n=1 Tax=Lagopus leucura TaxID=30410 RepID=UPI001C681050|nr:1-phosphatidylinositol 4,5-bisphosphate phosphodiesterase delta-3-like isoform X1 [Lagopus leucura]